MEKPQVVFSAERSVDVTIPEIDTPVEAHEAAGIRFGDFVTGGAVTLIGGVDFASGPDFSVSGVVKLYGDDQADIPPIEWEWETRAIRGLG